MTSTEGLTATCAAALGLPNLTRTGDLATQCLVERHAQSPPGGMDFLPLNLSIYYY